MEEGRKLIRWLLFGWSCVSFCFNTSEEVVDFHLECVYFRLARGTFSTSRRSQVGTILCFLFDSMDVTYIYFCFDLKTVPLAMGLKCLTRGDCVD